MPVSKTRKPKAAIKARPTMYRGILMRSRLEADFAAFLDRNGAEWEYEPTCFAGPDGQWLPDFRVKRDGYNVYIEVKPDSTEIDEGVIDPILEQMAVAWLTEPTATLHLAIWSFRNPARNFSIMGCPHEPGDADDRPIWWMSEGASDQIPWAGMGQGELFDQLLAEAWSRVEAEEARQEPQP